MWYRHIEGDNRLITVSNGVIGRFLGDVGDRRNEELSEDSTITAVVSYRNPFRNADRFIQSTTINFIKQRKNVIIN